MLESEGSINCQCGITQVNDPIGPENHPSLVVLMDMGSDRYGSMVAMEVILKAIRRRRGTIFCGSSLLVCAEHSLLIDVVKTQKSLSPTDVWSWLAVQFLLSLFWRERLIVIYSPVLNRERLSNVIPFPTVSNRGWTDGTPTSQEDKRTKWKNNNFFLIQAFTPGKLLYMHNNNNKYYDYYKSKHRG